MNNNQSEHPILYSLQHCPYAIRARIGIYLAKQPVMLRAINMKNKPEHMLQASPKATVPVLILPVIMLDETLKQENSVVDESLDIMLWALSKTDPQNLLYSHDKTALNKMLTLITLNDKQFKPVLEKYKFAKRKHEVSEIYYRQLCEVFIQQFENTLKKQPYFMGETPSLADYALLPFIRQFARVDKAWYRTSPYVNVKRWLDEHLQQPFFTKVMAKYPLWLDCGEAFLYGEK
ncbi:glutathione S-transferase [Marinicellulosiphila megalodicopiae]|uniref:glutathione S-transferase n=1 Tax=Marinicellulosiphila megalodicopiae TaxID=2724896 RepID=UPI003BB18D56